jgi:hypothetical protein
MLPPFQHEDRMITPLDRQAAIAAAARNPYAAAVSA